MGEKLTNCYQNIFKESIMKYILKKVIKQEIEQLLSSNDEDWKRVSLIKKISKLTYQNNYYHDDPVNTKNLLGYSDEMLSRPTIGCKQMEPIENDTKNTCKTST